MDFCACIPPNNDISQCDKEYDLDLICTGSSSTPNTNTALCYPYLEKIVPVVTCNQGRIQRMDVVKNPLDLGFSNEETLWSCNSFDECASAIPLCTDISISDAPTGAPIELWREDIDESLSAPLPFSNLFVFVTIATWIAKWIF